MAFLATVSWRLNTTLWRDARSFWEYTLAVSPRAWAAHFNLANLHVREQRPDDAIPHYRAVTELRPDLHEAWGALATIAQSRNDDPGALAAYEHAIAAVSFPSARWVDYRCAAAEVLQRSGRGADAERYFKEIVSEKPQIFRGHLRYAQFLERQQRWPEAAAQYMAALKAGDRPGANDLKNVEQALLRARSSAGQAAP